MRNSDGEIYFYGDVSDNPCRCTREKQDKKACPYFAVCAEQTVKDKIMAKELARAESDLIKKFVKSKGLYDELLEFALSEAAK